ncbi:MAG: hypothetical protein ACPG31_08460 [Planctomycetota bacterium]
MSLLQELEPPTEVQEPEPAPVTETEVPAPAPQVTVEEEVSAPVVPAQDTSKEAAALLEKVAEAQFPKAAGQYVDTIDLGVVLHERGEHPRDVSFAVFYSQRGGDKLELIIDDPDRGTRVAKGFSERDYWLREDGGDKVLLSGHEYTEDRKSIDEAMDLCSDLLLLVDVRGLQRRDKPTALTTLEDGTRILSGQMRRPDGLLWDYRLAIPADSLHPSFLEVQHVLEMEKVDSSESSDPIIPEVLYQRFEMIGYKAFKGRQAPQIIDMYYSPEESLMPARSIELHRFEWAAK